MTTGSIGMFSTKLRSETGTGFPILESTGGANPAEKAEWGKCGVKTEQDANNIGAGIFRFGELVAT